MNDLHNRIKYELNEIMIAHNRCNAARFNMMDQLYADRTAEALHSAKIAMQRAGELYVMLSHVAKVLGREVEAQSDDFESAKQVYGD